MKTALILKYPTEVSKLFYYFKSIDITECGNSIKTFSNFISCIDKMADKLSTDKDVQKKFKGDMLEIFAEIFFTCFENDPEVGLTMYSPVSIEEDYGCDGSGVAANGLRCAVQVKFRNNPTDCVTYEELAKTDCSARRIMCIDTSKEKTLWLFTSAYDVSNSARKVLGDSLVVIGKNQICYKVDNNISFWDKAWEMIKEHR